MDGSGKLKKFKGVEGAVLICEKGEPHGILENDPWAQLRAVGLGASFELWLLDSSWAMLRELC